MTISRWILVPLTTIMLWAAADRLHVENRISAVEAAYKDIQYRLDRIEGKVDTLVQRGDDAR